MADLDYLEFNNLSDCLSIIILLLENASFILSKVIDMPLAEPDDPVWEEFQKKPHVHEAVEVFYRLYDAKNAAKLTLSRIASETPSGIST
ncbi:MAG: hypothetical protein IJM68_00785 [Synergistaceae bacterium]|nr:hypothetical protein [Synergistaceae bacterium]